MSSLGIDWHSITSGGLTVEACLLLQYEQNGRHLMKMDSGTKFVEVQMHSKVEKVFKLLLVGGAQVVRMKGKKGGDCGEETGGHGSVVRDDVAVHAGRCAAELGCGHRVAQQRARHGHGHRGRPGQEGGGGFWR